MTGRFDTAEIRREDLLLWDSLVDQSVHGTIFHKTGWLNACARSLGRNVKIFGCFQDGQLVGGCSLFLKRKWGVISKADSTCVNTPYGGFVLSSLPTSSVRKQETFFRKILESLIYEIYKEQFYSVCIRNNPEFLDLRPLTLHGWRSSVLYTYYINLLNNPVSQIDSKVKGHIRTAERNRIAVEPFSDISKYYDLYCETYTRKNLKPEVPKRFFEELFAFMNAQKCGEMVVARTPDDDIACAEIVIWDNRMAYSWSAVSDSRFQSSGASSFIMMDTIKRMKERGFSTINIMMANVPHLSSFAASFNPVLVPYYQIRHRIDTARSLKNYRWFMVLPWIMLVLVMNLTETAVSSAASLTGSFIEFWFLLENELIISDFS
jgi:hypothetical protein